MQQYSYRNTPKSNRKIEDSTSAEEIAGRFPDSKRSGKGWLIRCPVHKGGNESTPSLEVWDDPDKDSTRPQVNCYAGCTSDRAGWERVLRGLGLWRESGGRRNGADPAVDVEYAHSDGKPRIAYRLDYPENFQAGACTFGASGKNGPCGRTEPHKHTWLTKGAPVRGTLLKLWGDSEVATLVAVEGGKTARALMEHVAGKPFAAMTWYGGASNAHLADYSACQDRHVILWPDADDAGAAAMEKAGRAALAAGAASLRIVDISGLPPKADAADVDRETALELLASAEEFEPPELEKVRQVTGGIRFHVFGERGQPLRSDVANAVAALGALDGLEFSYDEFAGQKNLNGEPVDDHGVLKIGYRLSTEIEYSPTKDALFGAVELLCRRNPFHPVRDYLNALRWDGKLRLNRLAEDYLNAGDDPVVVAAAKLIPYGMVGRVLQPGSQYDYAVVLQGPQGCGKSSTLRILAGEDWHSDSVPLTGFDPAKTIIERTRGKWVVELSELAGFRFAEQETLKGAISARSDTARMAYGREATGVKRQFIFCGTTNSETFLRDTTGARRFPVVPCGVIDLDALARDRDHLLAEAVHDVKKMLPGPITMPPALFKAQAVQAEGRRSVGQFEDWLAEFVARPQYQISSEILSKDLREAMREDLAGTPAYPNNAELSAVMEGMGYRQKNRHKQRMWVRE